MAWRGRRRSSEVNAGLLAASDTFPGIRARVDLGVGARHGQLVLVLADLGVTLQQSVAPTCPARRVNCA